MYRAVPTEFGNYEQSLAAPICEDCVVKHFSRPPAILVQMEFRTELGRHETSLAALPCEDEPTPSPEWDESFDFTGPVS